MTEQPTTKVLFIAGSGRSGSTLLGNILGEIEGFFFGGELRYLWERGLIQDRLCGCGLHFGSCPLWQKVLAEACGDIGPDAAKTMIEHQAKGTRIRQLPLILGSKRMRDTITGRLGEYPKVLDQLYQAIRTVTGCRAIVDSSKLPTYGHILETIPSIDLRVVHLIRDPRAAAYSWLRKKVQPDRGSPGYMESQGPVKSSLLWSVWNATTEALWERFPNRYLRLRYEDLIVAPREAVRRILDMVEEPSPTLPFVDDHAVALGVNHSVAGNPDRLKLGRIELRPDEEWLRRMRRSDRMIVTAAAAPLLGRYGYPRVKPGS